MSNIFDVFYSKYADGVCEICNGSGEGMTDGSVCYSCGGTGSASDYDDTDQDFEDDSFDPESDA